MQTARMILASGKGFTNAFARRSCAGRKLLTEGKMIENYGNSLVTAGKVVKLLQRGGMMDRFADRISFTAGSLDATTWRVNSVDDLTLVSAETPLATGYGFAALWSTRTSAVRETEKG